MCQRHNIHTRRQGLTAVNTTTPRHHRATTTTPTAGRCWGLPAGARHLADIQSPAVTTTRRRVANSVHTVQRTPPVIDGPSLCSHRFRFTRRSVLDDDVVGEVGVRVLQLQRRRHRTQPHAEGAHAVNQTPNYIITQSTHGQPADRSLHQCGCWSHQRSHTALRLPSQAHIPTRIDTDPRRQLQRAGVKGCALNHLLSVRTICRLCAVCVCRRLLPLPFPLTLSVRHSACDRAG